MSIPLADALALVDLETGGVYRCEVQGRLIEVRVLEKSPASILPTARVEEFDGFVDQIEGDVAQVTLQAKTGEILYGEYPAADLLVLGIRERRRFMCRRLDTGLHVEIDLRPIPNCSAVLPVSDVESFSLTPFCPHFAVRQPVMASLPGSIFDIIHCHFWRCKAQRSLRPG